jgi:hypothetical protein
LRGEGARNLLSLLPTDSSSNFQSSLQQKSGPEKSGPQVFKYKKTLNRVGEQKSYRQDSKTLDLTYQGLNQDLANLDSWSPELKANSEKSERHSGSSRGWDYSA